MGEAFLAMLPKEKLGSANRIVYSKTIFFRHNYTRGILYIQLPAWTGYYWCKLLIETRFLRKFGKISDEKSFSSRNNECLDDKKPYLHKEHKSHLVERYAIAFDDERCCTEGMQCIFKAGMAKQGMDYCFHTWSHRPETIKESFSCQLGLKPSNFYIRFHFVLTLQCLRFGIQWMIFPIKFRIHHFTKNHFGRHQSIQHRLLII